MHTSVYGSIDICTHMHTSVYVHVYVCVCICMHTQTCCGSCCFCSPTHTHVHTSPICAYIYISLHVYAYILLSNTAQAPYISMYACIYVHSICMYIQHRPAAGAAISAVQHGAGAVHIHVCMHICT